MSSRPSSSSGILRPTTASSLHSPRKIRFAPLPDPRRSVLVTEDGQELPIPDDNQFPSSLATIITDSSAAESSSTPISSSSSESTQSATSTPNTVTPASSVRSSPVSTNTALPKPIDDSSASTSSPPSAWPKSLFLLRPFKRSSASSSGSSSHSLTPTPSIEQARSSSKRPITTEEILTLGTINLFRTASRESRNGKEKENDVGWGLSRWSSSSASSSIDRGALLSGSSPLARTQSAGSYTSKKTKKASLFSTSSSSSLASEPANASDVKRPNPRPTTTPAKASKYKGTRMLNGRVYGAARNHHLKANPFATARDEEPEFVEWGYGGMGSVKGAKSAGVSGNGVNWARLSGGSVLKDSNSDESRPSSGAAERDDDDEDGSGMGWVRRRREERERKKKEEEEAKAAASALAVPETKSQDTTPTPTRSSTLDAAAFEGNLHPVDDTDATPLAAPTSSPLIPSKPVHITEAITIPVHKPHHHHHRNHSYGHSRTKSKEALEISVDEPVDDALPALNTAMSSESAMVTPTPASVQAATTRPRSDSVASTDSSASETESESDSEDANTPGDEDEDEDDKLEMERRKTALGAGVEKISRHGAAGHA